MVIAGRIDDCMIIKSSQRAKHQALAVHLLKHRDDDGYDQTITVSNGRYIWPQDDVKQALADMEDISRQSSRVQKDLYHVTINPSEPLTEEQWGSVFERYEQEFGLEELAFIEVTHDKKGRVHKHRVYERVNIDTGKAIQLSHTRIRNEFVARQVEFELGHQLTVGKHNRTIMLRLAEEGQHGILEWMEQGHAHEIDRPVAKEDFDDIQQDRRTGITKAEVKRLLSEAYENSTNGTDFAEAIGKHGLQLCREIRQRSEGRKSETFVVVDAGGDRHSPRRLLGTNIGQLRERWADFETATASRNFDTEREQSSPSIPSKQQVRVILLDAYRTTDSGAGFEAALADHNLLLCRGDRRAFAVVDAQGTTYSPPRLLGVKTSELKERWADVDPNTLLLAQEAKALREVQWVRMREEQASEEIAAACESMTATDRHRESKLLAEITALEAHLYQEFRGESLGAETHAATVRLGLLPDDFEQWQQEYALPSAANSRPQTFEPGQTLVDQRSLITQLQHWQTIAASDSERLSPQDSIHGAGRQTVSTDNSSTSADITSWGLSPTTLLMVQTYGGRHAETEQLRRIEAALAAASGAAGTPRSRIDSEALTVDVTEQSPQTSKSASEIVSEQEQEASTLYRQELGQQLRDKGRNAFTNADRWLAEKLARRGYSRQQTRRVIAQSSPELMEQAPGQRVGYIRRIVERVYTRREQWQEKFGKAKEKLANKTRSSNTLQTKSRGAVSKQTNSVLNLEASKQQEIHNRTAPSSSKPPKKPKR